MEKYVNKANLQYNVNKTKEYVGAQLERKQDVLVSGTNIKTINNTSLLGSGDILIEGVTNYEDLNNLPQINSNTLIGNQTSNELGLQDTLVNQENIKSINGNSLLGSGNLDIRTYQPFPSSWSASTSGTTNQFCAMVDSDSTAVEGMAYLGELRCSDFNGSGVGIINGEAIVEIFAGSGVSGKTIHITLSSGDTNPYRWEYTYWASGARTSGWIGFQPKLTAGTNITISGDTISATDTTYTEATYNDLGLVKLGSETQSSQTIETASSTAGRQYPVQVDSNGRASVNVPWTDTTYTAGNGLNLIGEEFSVDGSVVALQSDLPEYNGTATLTTEALSNIVVGNKTYTVTSTRETATSGGATLSLVNTGDMYVWNNKQDELIPGNNIIIQNNVISAIDNTVLNGVAYREI